MAKRIIVLVAVVALVALAVVVLVGDGDTSMVDQSEPRTPSLPEPAPVSASEVEDPEQEETSGGSNEVSSGVPCGILATCDVYAFQDGTSAFWMHDYEDHAWVSLAGTPSGGTTAPGSSLCYDGGKYVYAFQGGTTAFWRYDIQANTWSVMAAAPGVTGDGASLTCGYDGVACAIYATQGGGTHGFWRYDIAGDTWTTTLAQPGVGIGAGGSMCYHYDAAALRYHIYVICGGGTNSFLRYDIGADSWDKLADVPANMDAGSSSVLVGDCIYVAQETGATKFLCYSISTGHWSEMTAMPIGLVAGSYLSYCPVLEQIFLSRGGVATYYSYIISSNSWMVVPPPGTGTGGGSDDSDYGYGGGDDVPITPGTLDLEVDGNDGVNTVKFTVTGANPGQSGAGTWTLVNSGTTAGYIDLENINVTNAENYDAATDEAETAGDGDTSDATGGGELGANLDVVLFVDTSNDGVADAGETVIYAGKLDDIPASYDLNLALAAGGTTYISLTWSVDILVGNTIMGDSTTLNMSIELSETSGQ